MTCCLAWIVPAILGLPQSPQGPTDPDAKALFERLVKEAPQGWAELEAKCQKVRFSGRAHSSGKSQLPDGGWRESSSSTQIEFKQNGPEHLFYRIEDHASQEEGPSSRLEKQTELGWARAFVANPRYTFEVGRTNIFSPFTLKEKITLPDKERSTLPESAFNMRTLNGKRYMYITMMWGTSGSSPFRELLNSNIFHLKKISRIHEDGKALIKIEYDREADPAMKTPAIHDAWAIFDPDTHWIAAEFGYTIAGGNQYSHQYKYKQDENRFPILQTSSYRITAKEGHSLFQLDFNSFEYVDVPLYEFDTPAFWIAEPDEPR